MALTTYAELQTAIANWLGRPGDTVVTDNDDDWITLAEQRIYYGSGEPGDPIHSPAVRCRLMETAADIAIDAQEESLPAGWLGARRVYINTDPIKALQFMPPTDFWNRWLGSVSGEPDAFTIEGDSIFFGPTPDGAYTVKTRFWTKFSALSGAVNALFTAAPNLWLYGSLIEAAIYGVAPRGMSPDQATAHWCRLLRATAQGLNAADQIDRFGGAPLVVRPS